MVDPSLGSLIGWPALSDTLGLPSDQAWPRSTLK